MVSEDFNDYTEVDPGTYITIQSATEVDFHCKRNVTAYLYEDRGAGNIGDFKFENNVEVTLHDHTSLAPVFAVSDNLGDLRVQWLADNVEMCWARFYYSATGPVRQINCFGHDGTTADSDAINGLWNINVPIYLTYEKIGITFSIKIYSDSARTNLLGTISAAVGETDTYRYLYALGSWNTGGTPDMEVTVRDFDEPALSVGSSNLSAGFIVQQADSENLAAGFEVRQGTEDLPGELIVRHPGSVEFLAGFISRQAGLQELLGEIVIRHPSSEEVSAAFEVGQGSGNLPGEFVVRGIIAQNLGGGFTVRHSASQDLAASFDGQAVQSLLAELIVRHPGSAELLAGFISRHADLQELLGELIVRHPGSVDLVGGFIVRQAGSENLLGKLIVRQAGSQDLAAGFAVRRTATPLELKGGFWVKYYGADLLANIYVRPTTSRATDFEVKDNLRGLTVRDVDRVMTVTPRRKMRVK